MIEIVSERGYRETSVVDVIGIAVRLPGRLPDLMFWITVPFLGTDGAAAERQRLSMLER